VSPRQRHVRVGSDRGQAVKAQAAPDPLWAEAHRRLIENVNRQAFVPDDGLAARACLGGNQVVLPAYVPYIGPEYFQFRPRILCYAINQNLSKHTRWTDDWVCQWGRHPELAIDRLNLAVAQGKSLPIKPYAEGFVPLMAAIALARRCRQFGHELPPVVDRVIAATNFVKFSTAEDASSSSIPNSWWAECAERYVTEEILALRPDVILGFGQRPVQELTRILGQIGGVERNPELLACRFPGRIPSVKARPLLEVESTAWQREILPLVDRIAKPPLGSYHEWRMLRFPGYFLDVARSWGTDWAELL